jgi:biotin synthase
MARYRRVQAAHWLIRQGLAHAAGDARYDRDGMLADLSLEGAELARLLVDGEAFRTSGCPGCNRPYYNERPGGPMYNYARPLTPDEAQAAIAACLSSPGTHPAGG